MKNFQFIVWAVIIAGGTAPAYAQVNPLVRGVQTVVKQAPRQIPWTRAVRLGGQAYVVPHAQVGQAVLGGMNHSLIGTTQHVRFNKVATALSPLGTTISRRVADSIVKPAIKVPPSFAGYYENFPQAWEQFTSGTRSKGGRLEVLLEAAYGEKPQFSGSFVESFNEVMTLANTPVAQGESAQVALERAFTQAQELKHGFFVIQVVGNNRRPKDTLLLDIENVTYISFNKSLGNAWAEEVKERTRPDLVYIGRDDYLNAWKTDPTITDRRATQGIILRIFRQQEEDMPKWIGVSLEGNCWTFFHLNAKDAYTPKELEQGLNIWTAWNKGYYILANLRQDRYLFASEKGKPLFATTREVDEYLLQQQRLNP